VDDGAGNARRSAGGAETLCIGWVEHVVLPELGLRRLTAKMDTGARTSALHVIPEHSGWGESQTDGRTVLVTLPSEGRGRPRQMARLEIRDWLEVRDTSGRIERRPVIETDLVLGPLHRRIRLTLTNRGDMRYPMLIGRTALHPGILVDPGARFLLGRQRLLARRHRLKVGGGPGTKIRKI